jgi:hypothetical protein
LCKEGKIKVFIKPNKEKETYDEFRVLGSRNIEKEINYGVIVERNL